jgi:hypothetical protein
MCKEEVEKIIDKKILTLKEELFSHTSKLLQHQTTSPKTAEELNKINNCYSLQGAKLTNMEEQLIEIKKGLDKNDAQHKEITEDGRKQHQETMDKLEEMSKTKADKEALIKVELAVNTKVEKDSFKELKNLVYWVLAFSATTLVGIVLKFLLDK